MTPRPRSIAGVTWGRALLGYPVTAHDCFPTVIGLLTVWRHNKPKTKNHLRNWSNWKFVSESEVFQKKTHFLFSLVLFLKLESSAVSFKFPKFGRQLPPFMGVVTSLGTALRSGGSCQGKKTKGVESRVPPKEWFISGQGNQSDLRPKISSWRTSEKTKRDKDLWQNLRVLEKIFSNGDLASNPFHPRVQ